MLRATFEITGGLVAAAAPGIVVVVAAGAAKGPIDTAAAGRGAPGGASNSRRAAASTTHDAGDCSGVPPPFPAGGASTDERRPRAVARCGAGAATIAGARTGLSDGVSRAASAADTTGTASDPAVSGAAIRIRVTDADGTSPTPGSTGRICDDDGGTEAGEPHGARSAAGPGAPQAHVQKLRGARTRSPRARQAQFRGSLARCCFRGTVAARMASRISPGHADAVLTCEVLPGKALLASGGEVRGLGVRP